MTKPLTKPKKREWKAWGVFSPRGALCDTWLKRRDAEWDADGRLIACYIRPVTISLAKQQPRRRKPRSKA